MRPTTIPRPRLTDRLEEAIRSGRKLILVSAPAGYGKSTTISAWIRTRNQRTAWISLDEADNDPTRFLTYLSAAIHQAGSRDQPDCALTLKSPASIPLKSRLTLLINQMDTSADTWGLVLDDYHLVTAQAIHNAVTYLIDHLPKNVYLVIATRHDPPFPLARLRGRGALVELRQADFGFTADEAAAFLKQVPGLALSVGEINALNNRTEGWITGLQLAALALQGRSDISTFVSTFSGSHRYVVDFLIEEVLERQPPEARSFLTQTSVLDRLCGPLCDAVIQSNQSQQHLESLNNRGVFIVPLDDERRWYRYHHLFAELLRDRLESMRPDQVRDLYARASHWHEDHGFITEAIRYGLKAGDAENVARLIEKHIFTIVEEGALQTALRLIDALPQELIDTLPWSYVARAWILANLGRFQAVEPALNRAEALASGSDNDRHLPAHIASVRAYIHAVRGDPDRAVKDARFALQRLPEDEAIVRGYLQSLLGVALRWLGDLDAATDAANAAVKASRTSGSPAIIASVLCDRAALELTRGHLHRAAATCREVLTLAGTTAENSGRPLLVAGRAHELLSAVLYEWNELPAAARHAEAGVALCERWGQPDFLTSAHCRLADVRRALGKHDGALESLNSAKRCAADVSPDYRNDVTDREALFWIMEGKPDAAERWARERGLDVDDPPAFDTLFSYYVLAHLLLTQSTRTPETLNQARHLLDRLLPIAERAGVTPMVIRIRLAQAVAAALRDDRAIPSQDSPPTSLIQALIPAETEGYIRTFVDFGPPVGRLLYGVVQHNPQDHHAREVLSAFHIADRIRYPTTAERDIEPLSARETEVLHYLAKGWTNQEIAQELVIALSTVKKHVSHILGKLDVSNRREAARKARAIGLLVE